ncbi:MAG6090-like repeat-containing lipoprotein [Mycoplasmopsis agalactiae]|uniref:MAG6090-like repeat-containing lipoprotein n=1 Tax=Mycoplasmopsis agalactiae TaxID=2110 RepID=UPI001F2C140C|nr:hypothetical protein [Mycoplasmopsis agalactiae]MCE6115447.1 hypothetical protein [Mycoplasmopsis agalactiae]
MKKKWILKGGLLALFSPLLSSACFVTNTLNPANPSNGTPPNGGGGSTNPGNGTNPGGGGTPDNGSRSGGGNEGKPGGNNQARLVVWSDIFRDSVSGEDILLYPTKEQVEKEEKRLEEEVRRILDRVKKENEEKNKAIIEKFEKEEKRLEEEIKKILEENKINNEKIFKEFVENKWKDIFDNSSSGSDTGSKGLYDYNGFNDKVLLKYKDWLLKQIKGYDAIINARENYSASLRKQYDELADRLAKELEAQRQDIKKKLSENRLKLNYLENEKLVKARKELAETKESKKDLLELLDAAKEEKEYYANVDKVASEEVSKVKSAGDKIEELEKKIKELEAKIESLSSQIKQKYGFYELILNVGRRITDLKKQNKYLETLIKDKQNDNFADSFVFNTEYKFNHELIKEWKPVIENNKQEIKEIEEEIGRFTSEYENVINEVDKLIQQQASNNKEKGDLDKELVKLTKEVATITKGTKDWKSYLEQKEKEVTKAKENVALYENESKRLADLMKTGDSEESKGEKEVKESEADLVQLRKEQERLLKEQKALEEKEKVISVLISQSDKNEERFDRLTFKYDVEKERLVTELEKIEKILEKRKQRRYKEIFEGGSARETGELFDSWFHDYVNNTIENEIKARIDAEIVLSDHKISASDITRELFDDEFSSLVKQAIERYIKHGNKHATESSNATQTLFDDKFSSLVKQAVERYIKHGNKHATESSNSTQALFDDEFASKVADAKARAKVINKAKWDATFNSVSLWNEITPRNFFAEYTDRIKKSLTEATTALEKAERDKKNIDLMELNNNNHISSLRRQLETDKSGLEKQKEEKLKHIEELNKLMTESETKEEMESIKEEIAELTDTLKDAREELNEYDGKVKEYDKNSAELVAVRQKIKEIDELRKVVSELRSVKEEVSKIYDTNITENRQLLEELKSKNVMLKNNIGSFINEIKKDEDIIAFIYETKPKSNLEQLAEIYKMIAYLDFAIQNVNEWITSEEKDKAESVGKIESTIASKEAELKEKHMAEDAFKKEESRITPILIEASKFITEWKEKLTQYSSDVKRIEEEIRKAKADEARINEEYEKIEKEKAKTENQLQRLEVRIRDKEAESKQIDDLEKAYEKAYETEILKLEKEIYESEKAAISLLEQSEKALKGFKA